MLRLGGLFNPLLREMVELQISRRYARLTARFRPVGCLRRLAEDLPRKGCAPHGEVDAKPGPHCRMKASSPRLGRRCRTAKRTGQSRHLPFFTVCKSGSGCPSSMRTTTGGENSRSFQSSSAALGFTASRQVCSACP